MSSGATDKSGARGLTTRELQERLRELGQSAEGQRNIIIWRYERCEAQEDQEEVGGVEARACDGRALMKNMSCSLKYEILNQLTYITTSLKRSDSANRTSADNSYADAETLQHSPLR